jgi:hypothetical protein
MGFPEGSGVEFRVLSYSSQSEYRMNKQQQQRSHLRIETCELCLLVIV